jgi:hypothetical protein
MNEVANTGVTERFQLDCIVWRWDGTRESALAFIEESREKYGLLFTTARVSSSLSAQIRRSTRTVEGHASTTLTLGYEGGEWYETMEAGQWFVLYLQGDEILTFAIMTADDGSALFNPAPKTIVIR